MPAGKRLTNAYQNAFRIPFDDDSKFIIFSDCHRGNNSFADDFANNRNSYFHALSHYYRNGFTYCELGDGDELWENLTFESIFEAHKDVFLLMRRFFTEGRLFRIVGNHDMVYSDQDYVEKHLYTYCDTGTEKELPLFPGISFPESLILEHKTSGQEILMLHGHQADWLHYYMWKIDRFLVRVLWRQLQIFGISDPTSPAKNNIELNKIERRIKKWIVQNNDQFIITGHTHRPRFPSPGEIPYFNDGSCVHPRSITGLEIEEGAISLVKWQVAINEEGFLKVIRIVLEGPQKLIAYQKAKHK
jgi:predicted phosphodiesterase